MSPPIFPLRWESTGDQWWYASPIDWAAANGLYDIVLELLHQDANLLIKLTSLRRIRRLETVWEDGEGFHNVAHNRSCVARKLLEECESSGGNNSLIRAGYGGWLLYTAASAGDMEFIKKLLERDPLIVFGEGEYGVTDMLYAAAKGKNDNVFQLILDFALLPAGISGGEEVEEEKLTEKQLIVKEEMAKRGVHGAARGGHVAMLDELLDLWGYDIVSDLRDAQGASLLHSSSSRGQVNVVEYLISKHDSILMAKDSHGNTALHVATSKGHLPVVKALLLASSSLISLTNNHGDTCLHTAVSGFAASGFKRLDRQMELLRHLVYGNSVKDIVNVKNSNGRTALHLAVMNDLDDVVEILMKIPGVDLNVSDSDDMTPVDLVRRQWRKSPSSEILIKRLVSAGGRSNVQDSVYSMREEQHGFCGSPGTLFMISDSEIFLYAATETGSEISPDGESYDSISICSTMESDKSIRMKQKRVGARLNLLLRWAHKEETEKDRSFSGEKELEDRRVPLRDMYSGTPENEGRKFPMRRSHSENLPSLSARMKFTEGLMKGVVVHKAPRFVFSPPVTDFSREWSGYSTPPPETPTRGRVDMSESTDSTPVMKKQGSSRDKKFINRYLCFGAQGLTMEYSEKSTPPPPRPPRRRSFRRAITFDS